MNLALRRIIVKNEDYHKIISVEGDEFLHKYSRLSELQRLQRIGYFCAMEYCSKHIYKIEGNYTEFNHSYTTAKMGWRFSRDPSTAIAALFHDKTTPATSHVIDIMHRDSMVQEHTERSIADFVNNSEELLKYLKEDGILPWQIINYRNYNIVDNERPQLNVDRLDGIFTSSRLWGKHTNLKKIKEIYDNMILVTNEYGKKEIGFKNIEPARKLFDMAIKEGYLSQDYKDKLSMRLLADIIELLIDQDYIDKEENYLYNHGDSDVINMIKGIKVETPEEEQIRRLWETFTKMRKIINTSDKEHFNYCKNNPGKYYCIEDYPMRRRYVDPLIQGAEPQRLTDIDPIAREQAEEFKNYEEKPYIFTKLLK